MNPGIVCTRSTKLDKMRKVKYICVAVVGVLFEHLTADWYWYFSNQRLGFFQDERFFFFFFAV